MPLFVVNGFRVLARDWFVEHELGDESFPPDRYGLTPPQRLRLALTGLHSIQPGSEGMALLERATLPDGSPAFDERELRHMRDVRSRLLAAYHLQLVVLALLLGAAVILARSRRGRLIVPRGLLGGSLLTVAVALLSIPLILLGWEDFFLGFHEVFFSGNSWRFGQTDTLLRIYPDAFWQDTARLAAALAVAQAAVVGLVSWWWLRRLDGDPRAPAAA